MLFKIEFEDRGQDFLSWTIDTQKEQVVDCQPFQSEWWVGKKTTQKAFEVGGKVKFVGFTGTELELIHPIQRIEIITE